MHDDHEIGIVDRRDRDEVAHQLILTLRHQRFVRGLRIGHHQERVAVGRRFGRLLRADHAARAGAVFHDEGLAEAFLQHIADQAGRDVGGPPGPKGTTILIGRAG